MSSLPQLLRPESMSRALFKERNLGRLVEKFKKACENDRFRTKTATYEGIIRRLASAKRFRWIREILEDQKKYNDIKKEGFNARLITLYGDASMFDDAQKVFDEMPERSCKRTVLSFNALLSACVNSRQFDKLDILFNELPSKLGVEVDLVSYNIVMKGYCKMGSLDSAILLLDEMEKKGFEPDLITYNVVLTGIYSSGRFSDGESIWSQMLEKNVVPDIRSYNARILGLAIEKRTNDAVFLFEEMVRKGILPDIFSFNSLIKGFVNEENLEVAKRWYGKLVDSGCKQDKSTFILLIPFVCHKNDYEFAFELAKDLFNKKIPVGETVLQLVVDGLVKGSKIEEAKQLLQVGKENDFRKYKLNMPVDGSS